jgi:hypothetical protein
MRRLISSSALVSRQTIQFPSSSNTVTYMAKKVCVLIRQVESVKIELAQIVLCQLSIVPRHGEVGDIRVPRTVHWGDGEWNELRHVVYERIVLAERACSLRGVRIDGDVGMSHIRKIWRHERGSRKALSKNIVHILELPLSLCDQTEGALIQFDIRCKLDKLVSWESRNERHE